MYDMSKIKELLKQAADPDNGAVALAELTDAINDVEAYINTADTNAADLTERVAKLRDANMQLFLRQTSDITDSMEEPELDPVERLRKMYFNKEV